MAIWFGKRINEIVEFNPRETIKKGTIAKKIAMDELQLFCRDILEFELESFSGGTKFRNGDTIMARITPCLENGKTAKVNILDDGEVGLGSTEYIVFRAKEGVDKDFIYYFDELGQRLNITKVHPHKFRRTLTTSTIDKGRPIEKIQQLLEH